jgi:phosphoribosylanthranilate isomerase
VVAVKICGVTSVEDALGCVEAGADAIGINFYAGSPRCCPADLAASIVEAIPAGVLSVGVFVDESYDGLIGLRDKLGLRCLQLHGQEPPELLQRLLPHAYKAIRVAGPSSLEEARRYGGEHILLDAHVAGQPGGTGTRFDWALAQELAQERKLTLAGGLTPDNVADAVSQVRPFCVDVASGVEAEPRKKDLAKVRQFIERAKAAS